MSSMTLTNKQKRFVDEYLIDLNATQAAIRAGYSKKTAKEQGYRLLTKVHIQEYLTERYQEFVEKGDIATPEQVLSGYTQDAEFDPRKLFDENKNPIPIADLPDEVAKSLAGFEIIDTVIRSKIHNDGGEIVRRVYKYKLPDKHKNRDSLSKYHRLFNDKLQLTGKYDGPIQVDVIGELLNNVAGKTRGLPNRTQRKIRE